IVTVSLILLVLRHLEWSLLLSLSANLSWAFLILSLGFLFASHILNVSRWAYLLQEPCVEFRTLVMCYGAGLFSNNFLPTGVGGDGVRAMLLGRRISLTRALFSVVLDRGIGTVALAVLLGGGLWLGLPPGFVFAPGWVSSLVSSKVIVSTGAFILGVSICILLMGKTSAYLRDRCNKVFLMSVDFGEGCKCTWGSWWYLLGGGYVISMFSHAGIVAAHWAAMRALGVEVSMAAALWLVLVGSMTLLVPITINGLGLLETAYVVVLGCYGISATLALGVALLIRLLMTFFSVLGGLLSLGLELPSTDK
ncbi:MAG: lysylphosphatidylglycerol synthase transmembrane domain-containing protein, partial [Candidatus Binatia bacterium]